MTLPPSDQSSSLSLTKDETETVQTGAASYVFRFNPNSSTAGHQSVSLLVQSSAVSNMQLPAGAHQHSAALTL